MGEASQKKRSRPKNNSWSGMMYLLSEPQGTVRCSRWGGYGCSGHADRDGIDITIAAAYVKREGVEAWA
jgi:hypothetical protein